MFLFNSIQLQFQQPLHRRRTGTNAVTRPDSCHLFLSVCMGLSRQPCSNVWAPLAVGSCLRPGLWPQCSYQYPGGDLGSHPCPNIGSFHHFGSHMGGSRSPTPVLGTARASPVQRAPPYPGNHLWHQQHGVRGDLGPHVIQRLPWPSPCHPWPLVTLPTHVQVLSLPQLLLSPSSRLYLCKVL